MGQNNNIRKIVCARSSIDYSETVGYNMKKRY